MKTKTIQQSVVISATPQQVYSALMNSAKHSRFTGERASITNKVGGKFSCYGGYLSGVNVELKPAKLIVQAWRSLGWPEGYYSIAAFKLSKAGQKKTKLQFTQIGVPASDFKEKSQGWKTHYWKPLQAMFE